MCTIYIQSLNCTLLQTFTVSTTLVCENTISDRSLKVWELSSMDGVDGKC